ncbi:hypothetical protein COOONC_25853 [Cooperia oncophora]
MLVLICIVLDFEKAAIHAAKMVFPTASVECCAFHLAQAWNRKRNALTLKKYIEDPERDARFVKWWETLKVLQGMVFLPQGLLRDVRALHNPPVPSDHSAYADCQEFLDYLRTDRYSKDCGADGAGPSACIGPPPTIEHLDRYFEEAQL